METKETRKTRVLQKRQGLPLDPSRKYFSFIEKEIIFKCQIFTVSWNNRALCLLGCITPLVAVCEEKQRRHTLAYI